MLILKVGQAVGEYRSASHERIWLKDLARRLSVEPATLRQMHHPAYNTTLRTLERIARELKIPALKLVEEVSEEKGKKIIARYEADQARKREKAAKRKAAKHADSPPETRDR